MKNLLELLRYFISCIVIIAILYLFDNWHLHISRKVMDIITIPIFLLSLFILIPEAIFHPKEHKTAWVFFAMAMTYILLVFLTMSSYGLHELAEAFAVPQLILFIIFFFLDRSHSSDKKNPLIKLTRSIFFISAATIGYAIFIYTGLTKPGFAFLGPIVYFPFYLATLSIWIYRGWIK